MNYFKDIPDQHLKEFILEDLKCINNIISFSYPHSSFENDDIEDHDQFFSQHIEKCKIILKNYINYKLSEVSELEDSQRNILSIEKSKEIYRMCDQEVQIIWESLDQKEIHLSKKVKYLKVSNNLLIMYGEITGSSFFEKIKNLFLKPRQYE